MPTPEQERAMIVAYTGLWQLRDLTPDAEPEEFRVTRVKLRERLDSCDEKPARRRGRLAGLLSRKAVA